MKRETRAYFSFLIETLGLRSILRVVAFGFVAGLMDVVFLGSILLMTASVTSAPLPQQFFLLVEWLNLNLEYSDDEFTRLSLFLFILCGSISGVAQLLLIKTATGAAFDGSVRLIKKIFSDAAVSFGSIHKVELQNILSDILNRLLPGVFVPAMGIFGKLGGLLLLLSIGIYLQPVIGLTLFVTGATFFWIKTFLHRQLSSLGDNASDLHKIKENFVISGSEYLASKQGNQSIVTTLFGFTVDRFLEAEKVYSVVNQAEKIFVEFLLLMLILIVTIMALYLSIEKGAIVALLVSLALVSYRTLPILTNLGHLKNSSVFFFSSYSKIQTFLEGLSSRSYHAASDHCIEISDVCFDSGGKGSIGPFTLIVNENDKIVISGPSGSGKTSIAKMICGRLEPKAGSIAINPNYRIEFLPQVVPILPWSIASNILLDHKTVLPSKWEKVIETLDLADLIELHGDTDALTLSLSGGEIQRIGIARLLLDGADIMILDEPTSALNHELASKVITLVCELGKTVVIISHDKKVLESNVFNKHYSLI